MCQGGEQGGGGITHVRLPYACQDGVRLWEYIPLIVPAILLVLVLPAWETTFWLTFPLGPLGTCHLLLCIGSFTFMSAHPNLTRPAGT